MEARQYKNRVNTISKSYLKLVNKMIIQIQKQGILNTMRKWVYLKKIKTLAKRDQFLNKLVFRYKILQFITLSTI